MIYQMVLNSQNGPHEIEVRHYKDGLVELWLPHMTTPIILKENGVRISFVCPGPPIPVTLNANWTGAKP